MPGVSMRRTFFYLIFSQALCPGFPMIARALWPKDSNFEQIFFHFTSAACSSEYLPYLPHDP